MDLLALDDQIYRAIFSAAVQSPVLTALVVAIYWINWNGLLWWVAGLLIARARGFVRRGWWEMLVVYLGMVDGWAVTELILKPLVRRPRPFNSVPDLPPTLIDHPLTFAFPSGDAAFAVCVERVAVGVHHPIDVIAGALIGTLAGLAAPRAVALIRRRARWNVFV